MSYSFGHSASHKGSMEWIDRTVTARYDRESISHMTESPLARHVQRRRALCETAGRIATEPSTASQWLSVQNANRNALETRH